MFFEGVLTPSERVDTLLDVAVGLAGVALAALFTTADQDWPLADVEPKVAPR